MVPKEIEDFYFKKEIGIIGIILSRNENKYILDNFWLISGHFFQKMLTKAVMMVKVILVKIENGRCQNRHYNINIIYI